MHTDYSEVTEIAGEPVTSEQLSRLYHRYMWATGYCRDSDVVECACGVGPGLGLLSGSAKSVEAGDISATMVGNAHRHYGDRVAIAQFSAEELPFPESSKDVVLLFEAIYYLPSAQRFVQECARVLRPGGTVLVVTANKDLWDFHTSPHTFRYYGVKELRQLFGQYSFECQFFGFQEASKSSLRQRVFRPLKRLAVLTGLMPRTMSGKRWLKKIVFGHELPMPPEVTRDMGEYIPPASIPSGTEDRRHKILYCAARFVPGSGAAL